MESATTYYAPAERAGADQLGLEARAARESPLIGGVLDAVEDPLLVLNEHRQVLLANGRAVGMLGQEYLTEASGKRPGELLGCIHSDAGPGGCGTAMACRYCGALQAVLSASKHKRPETRECLMTMRRDSVTNAAEFRVRATPFKVGPHNFTTVLFHDISSDKRREALERIFFHDVLNTIGGIRGWSETLLEMKDSTWESATQRIVVLTDHLAQEVRGQRILLEAECGELAPEFRTCEIRKVYDVVWAVFCESPAMKDRTLEIGSSEEGDSVVTDPDLLGRVLENLVKNALEATDVGGTARIWHSRNTEHVIFHVWNARAIDADVSLRVFQRSFSTKAETGRGLGTYSAKLLVERYLGGTVSFRSTADEGTEFLVELPTKGTG